jgi:hypothetical protein
MRKQISEPAQPQHGTPADDHHFSSPTMLAAAAFLLVTWVAVKALFLLPSKISHSLKTDWQRHVLASSGYLELGAGP